MRSFSIGGVGYFSPGTEFPDEPNPSSGGFGKRLCDAIGPGDDVFTYQYDFGSTTTLRIEVGNRRQGRGTRALVRVLARNAEPDWPCGVCGESATLVCAYCRSGGGNPFVCDRHQAQHACQEPEALLQVVNSPRLGVCAYGGIERFGRPAAR